MDKSIEKFISQYLSYHNKNIGIRCPFCYGYGSHTTCPAQDKFNQKNQDVVEHDPLSYSQYDDLYATMQELESMGIGDFYSITESRLSKEEREIQELCLNEERAAIQDKHKEHNDLVSEPLKSPLELNMGELFKESIGNDMFRDILGEPVSDSRRVGSGRSRMMVTHGKVRAIPIGGSTGKTFKLKVDKVRQSP